MSQTPASDGPPPPTPLLFDQPYYTEINEARWAVLERLLTVVGASNSISSIIDAGCGPGWFAEKLVQSGFRVLGLEGRPELVAEARSRVPGAEFEIYDFDGNSQPLEPRDAVLAFGILYHLENPLRALRIFRAAARSTLFLETMTIPEPGRLARLVAENPNDTLGLRPMALVLTPEAIVQALFQVGFPHVYRVISPIDHPDFRESGERHKRRDVFVATEFPVSDTGLAAAKAVALGRYDYSVKASPLR